MSEPKQVRDVDSASQAQKLQALGWSMFGGTVVGLAGAMMFGTPGFLIGWIAGSALIFLVTVIVAGGAGSASAALYMNAGSSTPARREYSLGDALVAQGKFAPALTEFERCAAVYADDPEPRLRLARLQRDRLGDMEAAARWFREALAASAIDGGTESLVTRELTELFVQRMRAPERALPALARLAERQSGAASGAWARGEIAEIKRNMQESQ